MPLSEQWLASWADIKAALPGHLEERVVKSAALKRWRGVHRGEDLLHLAPGYCVLDKSLKDLGLWAVLQGIADLSAPALYGRLCEMNEWLGCLLDSLTHRLVQRLPPGFSSLERPLSFWIRVSLLWEQFQILIRGPLSLDRIDACLPKLQRFLCSAPRKRPQQLASALLRLQQASLPVLAPVSMALS